MGDREEEGGDVVSMDAKTSICSLPSSTNLVMQEEGKADEELQKSATPPSFLHNSHANPRGKLKGPRDGKAYTLFCYTLDQSQGPVFDVRSRIGSKQCKAGR